VGSCACLPWLSLLKLLAPNDTRACNSGLALSARHLGASTLLLSPCAVCTHVAQPSPRVLQYLGIYAAAVRHGMPALAPNTQA
jgi:hypothetical protein